jgi:acetate kinase
MRTDAARAEDLDAILNRQSGLLGISGLSGDMRDILAAVQNGNHRAKLAFDLFVHRLCACIGSMAASLKGLDVLVFTAGIGENSPEVRQEVCDRLQFLGVAIDQAKNSSLKPDTDLSSEGTARVLVIRAQEDWAIARECIRMLPSR